MRHLLVLLALSCSGRSTGPAVEGTEPAAPDVAEPTPSPPTPERPMSPAPSPSTGINATGLALYERLATGEDNVFFSPASIQVALGMTAAGARGATLEAMATALSLPAEPHSALGGLVKAWNEGSGDAYQLSVANRLWVQSGLALDPAYEQLTEAQYGAGVGRLDFATRGDAERAPINAWVEEQTQDRIKDLIPAGSLNASTRLVLTNAVYFLGKWATAFSPDATTTQPFSTLVGAKVDVALMRGKLQARYNEVDGAKIALVPYRGDALDMLVVLPDAGRFREVEASLSTATIDGWIDAAAPAEIDLLLPRFEATLNYRLAGPLSDMGMGNAFSRQADFSGITTAEPVTIDEVVHKAFVKVDEEGTEAAAATGVMMRSTSIRPPPPVMRCDRPFVFAIRDRTSGVLLFLGRVADPS